MYAIVDFVKEKAADGTSPCEIVHMSLLSPDMKFCSWPGNSQCCKAFKKGDIREDGWKKVEADVKYFSPELNLVRLERGRLLVESLSNTDNSDKEQMSPPNEDHEISEDMDSSDSEDVTSLTQPKIVVKVFPPPPPLPTKYFSLLNPNMESSHTLKSSPEASSTGNSGCALDIFSPIHLQQHNVSQNAKNDENPQPIVSNLDKSVLRRLERLERKIDDVHDFMRKLKDGNGSYTDVPND
ncbi:unnamed protein product [Allacma fusca]|uniref:Uncharacterized protein n=1 Tax=Allacma fusca TaxID=39272 RepID=A0A8J2JWK3_9HEXA|nr:unnamed protein product [Allacma fusca]